MAHKLTYQLKNPKTFSPSLRKELLAEIHDLIAEAWGHFPESFIDKHVMASEILALAYDKDVLAGFSAISQKKLGSKTVHYVEFTVLRPKYQGGKIGSHLTFFGLRRIFIANLLTLAWKPVEIMLITPNIRVLATLSKFADFIYPNPYQADPKTYRIEQADYETWEMAQALIKKSDDPTRKLDREGLVLHGSYVDTPWLIYDGDTIPWHRHDKVNAFARHYLGYGKKEDKEFIVRVTYGVRGLTRFLFSRARR